MKCRYYPFSQDFHSISLSLTVAEARDIRRALIFGLDVMRQQIESGSEEFKAGTFVNAERTVAELASTLDRVAHEPTD